MRRVFVVFVALAAFALLAIVPRDAWAKESTIGQPLRLEVKGVPEVYYFKPQSKGSKPILMYLHGRGGNPAEDCRKWARVGTQFGWVVCPSGPETTETGGRTWGNGAGYAQTILERTIDALREKYKGKVHRRGNVLIGFSEGAFVAMQVGLADQRTWNRWLILGASDVYWQQDLTDALGKKRKVHRVYLLTGENDQVAKNTEKVGELLKKAKVPVKVKIVPGMGHEVPSDRMISTYRRPLLWLTAE
jgi:predicted esterase